MRKLVVEIPICDNVELGETESLQEFVNGFGNDIVKSIYAVNKELGEEVFDHKNVKCAYVEEK